MAGVLHGHSYYNPVRTYGLTVSLYNRSVYIASHSGKNHGKFSGFFLYPSHNFSIFFSKWSNYLPILRKKMGKCWEKYTFSPKFSLDFSQCTDDGHISRAIVLNLIALPRQ